VTDRDDRAVRRSTTRRRAAVTLRDVAALAEVSTATASRALSGDSAISDPTRDRVAEAARALDYRPHAAARSLRRRSTQLLGVLVTTSGDAYAGEVVHGIELRARERGHQVLLAMSHVESAREREAFEVFLYQRVDGIIAVSPIGDDETMGLPTQLGVPLVIINWDVAVPRKLVERIAAGPTRGLSTILRRLAPDAGTHVRFDDTTGAEMATEHLRSLGHRRFAFVCGPPSRSSALRLVGFRRVLERDGLWPQPVLQPDPTLHDREATISELLARSRPPIGIVAYDDLTAIAALHAAHRVGWTVPDQLSVVGLDDIELAEYTAPALTTVAQPMVDLGQLSVDAALGPLRRRVSDTLLEGKLIVRGTTAPARRAAGGRRPRAVGSDAR
jgi:DNA-binding LacI/PurR family transcriptional regulator